MASTASSRPHRTRPRSALRRPTVVFAYELAHRLPAFREDQWTGRLESGATGTGGESSWNGVIRGMLQLALGRAREGRAQIESALLLPDRNLALHFGREALRSARTQ
jgi:hypothetical protein